jgi:hypothetical protein
VKRIGAAALRRQSVLRCGAVAVREEKKEGARFGEGALCFLYRAEREPMGCGEAVNGGYTDGRH